MTGSAVTPPRVAAPSGATPPAVPAALSGARLHPLLRVLPLGVLGCLALAALTLLAPSAPTYDPWSWIIWGREILHLDLNTVDGPSWKPLPVMFTTVFSIFGGAAPTLWVLVARAGAFLGVLMAFRLGRRLGGVPGGAAAAAGLLLAPWYIRNNALGNSEGLQVAFALAALDRHLEDRRRAAFGMALGLALLRPEAWPFVGLYGAWLAWTRRDAIWLVAAGFVSLPILWLLPEQLGSGDWLRASHRAQQPVGNSAAFSDNPVVEVLKEGAVMITPPVWAGLALMLAFGVYKRDRRIGLIALAVAAWVLLVALMTANGYSGNQRYLIVPIAIVIVLAGAGVGKAAELLVTSRSALALGALTAAAAALFALPSIHKLKPVLHGTSYQAHLVDELGGVVRDAGGAARLRACGPAYTGAYLVPAVAWQLRVHTHDVGISGVHAPAVVFRVRTTSRTHPVPPLGPLTSAHTATATSKWRVVTACR